MFAAYKTPGIFFNGYLNTAVGRIVSSFTTPATGAREATIRNCVGALMGAGIWSKLDALYMLAAATSQAALINWKNPGVWTLAVNGTPTFTADQGYTGNGTDGLLSSSITTSQYTQDNCHIAGFALTNSTISQYGFALTTAVPTPRAGIKMRNSTAAQFRVSDITNTPTTKTDSVPRFFAGDRSDSANKSIYINGVFDQTVAVTSTAGALVTVNFCGDGASNFTDGRISFGCFGASLSATQHAALNSAVRGYLQGVGAI